MIGTTEIVVVAATGLILFGSAALPKFARSIGQAKKELEKGIKEGYVEEAAGKAADEAPAAGKRKAKK